jgi:hypothetical protein
MSQLYPHVYFESGGIEEFDVDMMEEHDVELTLLDVAVIVNALDSINYAEKGVDLLMRKLTGVLSESMIILPHLDWEDRELIASEEEAYAEDEEEDEEDEDEEDEE